MEASDTETYFLHPRPYDYFTVGLTGDRNEYSLCSMIFESEYSVCCNWAGPHLHGNTVRVDASTDIYLIQWQSAHVVVRRADETMQCSDVDGNFHSVSAQSANILTCHEIKRMLQWKKLIFICGDQGFISLGRKLNCLLCRKV
jgi:hypothetical protein